MWEIAKEFGALIVFSEHRYYGCSMPYGDKSFSHQNRLGYLTTEQAIADYVDLIKDLRDKAATRFNTCRPLNPVITFGGSYSGMLSAYIRMKYPASVQG